MSQSIATPISTSAADTKGGFPEALSHTCFFGGFCSILVSIGVWVLFKSPDPATSQRFAIFIGLWAPTFFALSDRLDRYAKSSRRR